MEDDFKPCLQIVHISDLHIVAPESNGPAVARQISRQIRWVPLLAPLYHSLEDGIAPNDQFAPYRFDDFLRRITIEDAEWQELPTWLICTGDITTFGDRASLDVGKTWLESLSQYVHAALWLHGNHDEWPVT